MILRHHNKQLMSLHWYALQVLTTAFLLQHVKLLTREHHNCSDVLHCTMVQCDIEDKCRVTADKCRLWSCCEAMCLSSESDVIAIVSQCSSIDPLSRVKDLSVLVSFGWDLGGTVMGAHSH